MFNLIDKVAAGTTAPDPGTLGGALNPNTTATALTLGSIVTIVLKYLIWIAGILAFVYLVYSGILYITANGNPDQAKKGQQGIINAIIGIIIVVASYVILISVAGFGNNVVSNTPQF